MIDTHSLVEVPQQHEQAAELIDAGLVLYLGLFVLFLWRQLCAWRCCGKWLEYANYCSLLLALVFVIFAYDSYYFFTVAMSDMGKQAWDTMPGWLKPWVLASPFICFATYIGAAFQTFEHVNCIRDGSAVERHDKAVQIICLPAVYGVMGFSALTRVYTYLGTQPDPYSKANEMAYNHALARGEVCFWVGDLYESWALYQFGLLTLDIIKSNMKFQSVCGKDERERAAALALLGATPAVESLVWLGILSFVVCTMMEAGWALWLLTFETEMSGKGFDESMGQFYMAGFLASCAAIYNVFIVETSYSPYLESFYPLWKFFTVKILVTFAWVQKTIFKSLMTLNTMLPPNIKKACDSIPVIGQIMNFPKTEFELFYACLIMSEGLFICICHYWAWNSKEEWYDQAQGDPEDMPVDYRSLAPPDPSSPSPSRDRGALAASANKPSYGAFGQQRDP